MFGSNFDVSVTEQLRITPHNFPAYFSPFCTKLLVQVAQGIKGQ
jgi:hypothetical protein